MKRVLPAHKQSVCSSRQKYDVVAFKQGETKNGKLVKVLEVQPTPRPSRVPKA